VHLNLLLALFKRRRTPNIAAMRDFCISQADDPDIISLKLPDSLPAHDPGMDPDYLKFRDLLVLVKADPVRAAELERLMREGHPSPRCW